MAVIVYGTEYENEVKGYMDETGHSSDQKQRFNGMAGLIAPSSHWKELERKWKETLEAYHIKYFHMMEFENSERARNSNSSKNRFKDWSAIKKEKLLNKLLKIIETTYSFSVGSIISMDDFRSLTEDGLEPTEREAVITARRGQGKFRDAVLSYWRNCAVSNCCELTLLRASHIKPWKDSTNAERLDAFNGLLLNPSLDAAFDKGLITFADDGTIILSPVFSADDRKALGISSSLRLRKVSEAHVAYLRHHREQVFKKRKSTNGED